MSDQKSAGLTRYSVEVVGWSLDGKRWFSASEDPEGAWVRYEDANAALATIPAKPETKP